MASYMFELVIRVFVATAQTVSRITRVTLEWLFVIGAWFALLLIGLVVSFRRGGLPWTDPSAARATSRSPDR